MRFAVQHFVALLNGGLTNGLCQVTFARSAWAEKQSILALVDESTGSQIEDQAAIHFRIEAEVEVIERPVGIAKAGLLPETLQQPVGAASEFIRDQTRDQVDGSHRFGLSLAQSSFEHSGHANEPKL